MGDGSTVRSRNESAWLLPNNGIRTNRLRAEMRKYHPDEEVDVVIVGAGAGEPPSDNGWHAPGGAWC